MTPPTSQRLLLLVLLAGCLVLPPATRAAVELEQIESAGAEESSTLATATPLAAGDGDVLLVAVSTRPPRATAAVEGLGLQWSLLGSQCAGRAITNIEVWMARADQAESGPVTLTWEAPAASAAMLVSVYSGVDGTEPIGAVATANANGPGGDCGDAPETEDYAVELTVTDAWSTVYGAVALRNKSHHPGAGFTERGEASAGAGGSVAGVAVEDRDLFEETEVRVDGRLSTASDWAAIGVELRAADGGGAPVDPSVPGGIWISPAELSRLPVTGVAWGFVKAQADGDLEEPNMAGYNANHDVNTLAVALVYGRTGLHAYRQRAAEAIMSTIGTEETGLRKGAGSARGALAVTIARNLVSLVIAADLINLGDYDARMDARFREWIDRLRHIRYPDRSVVENDAIRANNHGRMAGASRLAVAIYLGERQEIDDTITVFKGILGDRDAYDDFDFPKDLSWQEDPTLPLTINAAGATKAGVSIDGALPEEMRRGCPFQIPPCPTGYPWEGLQGIVVEAMMLARRGHDVWNWQDQAIVRAVRFLEDLHATYPDDSWWADGDDDWIPWLINFAYGSDFAAEHPRGRQGKNMGWTDWTHAGGMCRLGSLLVCDDGNPCTDSMCDATAGECTHVANAATCDDGNACTRNDACSAGVCAGAAGGCCGNADGIGGVSAADALFMLKHAVGQDLPCPLNVCDVDGSGRITTTDVLLVLALAIGRDVELACQP